MDASDWDRRYAGTDLVWSAGPNRFVATELADLTPGRAIDVAAGEGRNSIWLAERGWDVTAVDFSRAGLEKSRALQARHERAEDLRIAWVHADVLEHDLGHGRWSAPIASSARCTTPTATAQPQVSPTTRWCAWSAPTRSEASGACVRACRRDRRRRRASRRPAYRRRRRSAPS